MEIGKFYLKWGQFLHKPHYENEVPFEVPESWEWTTIGELSSFLSRGKSPKYSEERKYPVFAQKCNLYDGDISLEKARFLDPETISKWSDEYKLIDGDILVNSTGTGTVGRTRLFHSDVLGNYPFVVPDSHVSVVRTFEEIESKFVLAFLSSDYGQTYIEDNLAGSTNQKELYIGVLDNMQFPLPPHEEQFRIVSTLDKWFALIDTLETAKEELHTFIIQAKSKILDLAIHGKLVPQDPNDEPAIELLKRINPKFSSCDNAHYPFSIPETWEWSSLDNISTDSADGPFGSNLKKEHYTSKKEVRIIQLSNIGDEGWRDENTKYTTFDHLKEISRSEVKPNDIVIAKMMPAGRAILCPDIDPKYVLSSDAVKFHINNEINYKYTLYAINSEVFRSQVYDNVQGVTRIRTSLQKLRKYVIPLPPYNEQICIVSKIEELFAILDEIQKSIEA